MVCSFWNNCFISSAFFKFQRIVAFFLLFGVGSALRQLFLLLRAFTVSSFEATFNDLSNILLCGLQLGVTFLNCCWQQKGVPLFLNSFSKLSARSILVLCMDSGFNKRETLRLTSISFSDYILGAPYLLVCASADKLVW